MMRRVRLRANVGVEAAGESIYAATLPDGPIIVLEQAAAVIWDEVCAGDLGTLAARVASRTGSEPEAIESDVLAFVGDLVRAGLLDEVNEASPGEPRD